MIDILVQARRDRRAAARSASSSTTPTANRIIKGWGNQLILPPTSPVPPHGSIHCRQRLGGMLTYYYRPAA